MDSFSQLRTLDNLALFELLTVIIALLQRRFTGRCDPQIVAHDVERGEVQVQCDPYSIHCEYFTLNFRQYDSDL